MRGNLFIACGMYAFSDDLRRAWQEIFDRAFAELGEDDLARELVFESGATVMLADDLYLGHTCGYPLVTHLKGKVDPICVALFDLPGCSGKLYSSRFIVPADSHINSLADCRGACVAVNTTDSQSGMNALRHALAEAGIRGKFFAEVVLSGGHPQSLEAVAQGRAQLAAIDCVTYGLIEERRPDLVSRVRSLGFSAQVCGLPFAAPRNSLSRADAAGLAAALDRAVGKSGEAANALHLTGFEAVGRDDYAGIIELERFAVECGYPELK